MPPDLAKSWNDIGAANEARGPKFKPGDKVRVKEPSVATSKPKLVTINNAPPNQRARLMRGMHDAVDAFFPDANSREIFGAGQRMSMMGKTAPSNLMQRFTQASNRIAKQYNLPIEKARAMVQDYNAHIRELSKGQPKYGDNLTFNAPSFEEFMTNLINKGS